MDERILLVTRQWALAQPIVSAFVTSVVRDFSSRDDVLQEIAVAIVESADRYDPERSFVGWALGIAQNQVKAYLRAKHRDRLVFSDEVVALIADAFQSQSPEELRKLEFLNECLEKLANKAKQMCELRYVNDLKPAAIAQRLHMSANAVAKALQRIRDQLRECIQGKVVMERE